MKRCSKGAKFSKTLFSLLLAALVLSNVSAQSIHDVSGISQIKYINIKVQANGFVAVEEDLEVNNTIARILLPTNSQDIMIFDSSGARLNHDSEALEENKLVTFYLRSPEDRALKLKYTTGDLTGKQASMWTFRFSTLSIPGTTIVKVEFPVNSEVLELRPTDILRSPKNLTTTMYLYPQRQDFEFEFDYQTTQTNGASTPYSYLPAFASGLVLLAVVGYFFLYRKKNPAETEARGSVKHEEVNHVPMEEVSLGIEVKGKKIKQSVLNMLEENELRVVEVIESAEDETTQAYIYKTTGIPKATLSDLMKRLEARNIIKRKRDGRTNWIKLQDWVFSK